MTFYWRTELLHNSYTLYTKYMAEISQRSEIKVLNQKKCGPVFAKNSFRCKLRSLPQLKKVPASPKLKAGEPVATGTLPPSPPKPQT